MLGAMVAYGHAFYETPDGMIVTLTATSNVKTKMKHKGDDNGESEDE